MMIAAKRGAPVLRKEHNIALELQKAADLRRKRIEHEKNLQNAKEEYIKAWDLIEVYHSDRGWKKLSQAIRVMNSLSSEAARLKAIKEQITIRVKGFGWKEAAHAWSKGGTAYDSSELMKHFVNVILPMEAKLGVPSEPTFKVQDNTTKYALGTDLGLSVVNVELNTKSVEDLKTEAMMERARREAEGETDCDANLQAQRIGIEPAPIVDGS